MGPIQAAQSTLPCAIEVLRPHEARVTGGSGSFFVFRGNYVLVKITKVTGSLTGERMRAALGRRSQLVVGLVVPLHRFGGQGHAWVGFADMHGASLVLQDRLVPHARHCTPGLPGRPAWGVPRVAPRSRT